MHTSYHFNTSLTLLVIKTFMLTSLPTIFLFSPPKVFVSNRLSHIDHIVLHLVLNCVTVSNRQGVRLIPRLLHSGMGMRPRRTRTALNKCTFDRMREK